MDTTKSTITIVSSTMVRPASETPRRTLWLSRLDMVVRQPYSHTRILFIYQPNDHTLFHYFEILKESLSKTLVPFYPMAGRLKINENNGRYEIDCNAEGVLFVKAETTNTLSDLLPAGNLLDAESSELGKCLSPTWDYSKGLSTIPLLMVQLTRFECGGVCVGFSQHHHVADGSSHLHFIESWGRLARGHDIIQQPIHDRFKYVAPRDPPQINKFQHLGDVDFPMEPSLPLVNMSGTMSNTRQGTFKLSKDQLDVLRQEAMSDADEDISSYKVVSTFAVLAGHVWRSACRARKLAEDEDVRLYIPISGRSMLPSGYFGNTIIGVALKAKAGDITNKPLWFAVKKVVGFVARMKDSECFRSAIDYIETRPQLLVRTQYTTSCPNLSINAWTKLPFDASDFGWGAPKSTIHGGLRFEGQTVVMSSDDDDGSLLVNIRLYSVHMALFEKFIYDFGKPNGGYDVCRASRL